ncbi:hypothetical protein [Streptomyces sp. NPDC059894]|uniref:hypothetical protein n=1 Tax=unclassified Streptomyces TaxID=2593676 RepID=UPI003647B3D4
METFVTVVAILALIALGVLLIHLLNAQHSDRIAAFHYARYGMPVAGPAPPVPRRPRDRARASGSGARPGHRDDDGGRGRLRAGHRTRGGRG